MLYQNLQINILEILENASHNIDTIFLKTKKIKDCQVVQTRISRHHGGKDHKTELQVGAVDENDLYKVMALLIKIICLLHGMVIVWCRQLLSTIFTENYNLKSKLRRSSC